MDSADVIEVDDSKLLKDGGAVIDPREKVLQICDYVVPPEVKTRAKNEPAAAMEDLMQAWRRKGVECAPVHQYERAGTEHRPVHIYRSTLTLPDPDFDLTVKGVGIGGTKQEAKAVACRKLIQATIQALHKNTGRNARMMDEDSPCCLGDFNRLEARVGNLEGMIAELRHSQRMYHPAQQHRQGLDSSYFTGESALGVRARRPAPRTAADAADPAMLFD